MEQPLLVDALDEAGARSLVERVGEGFEARAEITVGRSRPLGDLLSVLYSWLVDTDLPSLCVQLEGRAYVLDGRPGRPSSASSAGWRRAHRPS